MLKYIFAVLLIAAVWTTVILLELPYWIAIVATAVIVVILLSIVIYKVVKAKKAAREIEKALKAQADAHAANARPDLKADIDAMQGEFQQAVSALKSSKLGGKKASEALYALPWYMIIGPPGSGKSTALRNSGLRFPYLSKSGGGVQGVGGTRNCQWWMTNEAVILDTAGRYTTEDTDREEWMAFLDLLKKNRAKQPINGVLVAIAITDLSEAHGEEVLARAREIRARIDEVMSKLEMVVPVYVLFTKCDLLPGFVELFSDLGNKERNQIWGFTAPVTKKVDPAATFNDHFIELAGIIERRQIRRMTEERRAEARDKIYAFPQYFEPLKDNLAIFVGEMMAESIYSESPIFRGAYFTSGTQEGRPIDRIMNGMAEAFGIQPRMQMTAPQIEAKSYFLGEVFQRVVFADKHVATRSAARLKRQALIGHGIAALLLLVAVGMAILPVLSFRNNRDFLNNSSDALEKVAGHYASETFDPIKIEQIDPLRAAERELTEHEEGWGPPLMMRMGMYQGKVLFPKVRELYIKTVREQLIAPLVKLESTRMRNFVQKYGPISDQSTDKEHDEFRKRLRLVLLLTGPYTEGEPGLTEEQQTWLVEKIAESWSAPLAESGDVATISSMKEVAGTYVKIIAEDPGYLIERDTKLIAKVRKILRRTNRTDALLAELLRDIDAPNVDLYGISSSRVALKNDGTVVKGAYTRLAWDDVVRDRLENPFDTLGAEEWVLGRTEKEAEQSRGQLIKQLKSLYFENYIREWKKFIASIYVVAPSDFIQAQKAFRDLIRGGTPPLKRLCQFVHYHTNLPDAPTSDAETGIIDAVKEKGAQKIEEKAKGAGDIAKGLAKGPGDLDPTLRHQDDVRKAFQGLAEFGYLPTPPAAEGAPPPPPPEVPLNAYQELLETVGTAISAKIDHDGPEETKALVGAVKSARNDVDNLIGTTDTKDWDNTLKKLLTPPFDAVWRIAGTDANKDISKKWCSDVVAPLARLRKKYPMVGFHKGKMMKVAEITEFFAPESGKLWAYYGEALSSRVPRKHNSFQLATQGAASRTNFNPRVVAFLTAANDLTRAVFPDGDVPKLDFKVRIENNSAVAKTILKIDGLEIEHENGPLEFVGATWPGEGDPGAELRARTKLVRGEVLGEGPFGFFELIEQGTSRSSGDFLVVEWDLRDQEAGIAKIRFQPLEADNIFFGVSERPGKFLQLFRDPDLTPPQPILVGGPTCK